MHCNTRRETSAVRPRAAGRAAARPPDRVFRHAYVRMQLYYSRRSSVRPLRAGNISNVIIVCAMPNPCAQQLFFLACISVCSTYINRLALLLKKVLVGATFCFTCKQACTTCAAQKSKGISISCMCLHFNPYQASALDSFSSIYSHTFMRLHAWTRTARTQSSDSQTNCGSHRMHATGKPEISDALVS